MVIFKRKLKKVNYQSIISKGKGAKDKPSGKAEGTRSSKKEKSRGHEECQGAARNANTKRHDNKKG